ncbi:MAG: nitrophenyl compound nitroreductase subunit ArsF family protein [Prevotella sp.]|nr:nitrophenyl compound nitroreductase subunit ArsF family protein [Prevotella sp.]
MKKTGWLLLSVLLLLACGKQTGKKTESVKSEPRKDMVEVLYFYGKQRCATCLCIERSTKEILEKHYADDIKQKRLLYRKIDISRKENKSIAEKYEVSWSSLFLVHWKNGNEKVKNLTDTAFVYARSSPELFEKILRNQIDGLLSQIDY